MAVACLEKIILTYFAMQILAKQFELKINIVYDTKQMSHIIYNVLKIC